MQQAAIAPITVATFYQFTPLIHLPDVRDQLAAMGERAGLRGTILLAPEGINATVAGDSAAIDVLRAWLLADGRFGALSWKQTLAPEPPFRRFKVRIKREIVRFGVDGLDPAERTGVAVDSAQWHALLDDPQVLVIDTRNRYEVALGSFPGARDPDTRTFSEFAGYVERELDADPERPIAMFCTGGIRCEKASSFLLARGFRNVFQLRGGILSYLEQTAPAASRWQGECVVFDERVAVDHAQRGGRHDWCAQCGDPAPRAEGSLCTKCQTQEAGTNP